MLLLHSIHRLEQEATILFAENTKTKLTVRQAIVLQALKDNPSGSQTTLVKATNIDRSTLSDLIRRVQRKGWAKRTRNKQDQRAWVVQLTPEGHNVLQTAREAAKKAEKALAAKFPAVQSLAGAH